MGKKTVAHSARDRSLLLVGAKGRMGRCFLPWLKEMGFRVTGVDKEFRPRKEALAQYGTIVVSVPIPAFKKVVSSFSSKIAPGTLLVDVTSLKEEPCRVMAKSAATEVLGLHPMFGPQVRDARGQRIIVCKVRVGRRDRAQRFLSGLKRVGFELTESTPKEHDRMMAFIQGLLHQSKIAMALTLAESGVSLKKTVRFMSPLYRLELCVLARIFTQNAELYYELLRGNKKRKKVVQGFHRRLEKIDQILDRGKIGEFQQIFRQVRESFGEISDKAAHQAQKMIEIIK